MLARWRRKQKERPIQYPGNTTGNGCALPVAGSRTSGSGPLDHGSREANDATDRSRVAVAVPYPVLRMRRRGAEFVLIGP